MKIYSLYIVRRWIKLFFFILFSFYIIYSFIDYSFNFHGFLQSEGSGFHSIFQYYLLLFARRAKVFFPLATLLSTIHLFCNLNRGTELVAFQAGGIRLKQLAFPVIVCSLGAVCITFALSEWVLPHSFPLVKASSEQRFMQKEKKDPLFFLSLEDDTKFIYQKYDRRHQTFHEALWIKNGKDFWRIKRLEIEATEPIAFYAEHILRTKEGLVEKQEEVEKGTLPGFVWKFKSPEEQKRKFGRHSMKTLWRQYQTCPLSQRIERSKMLTQLLFKGTIPFLSTIAVIAVFPYCTVYRRNFSYFLIYGFALFGFVAYLMFFDAAMVLADYQCLSPYMAILLPFIALFGIFGFKFIYACKKG